MASAKWSVLQAALFCPFSAGRRAHCGVGPTAPGRLSSNAESQSQNFIYKTPTSPSPDSSHPDSQLGVSACYGFVFVHLCLLSFCQNTQTHTGFQSSCQSRILHAPVQAVPTFTLCHFVVQRCAVMSRTETRFPLAPSATEEPTYRCVLCGSDET